jgi:hypothetical protein
MLMCSNCVVRLSPLLCRYFATCSLSSLSSKSCLSFSSGLGNSLQTAFPSSSNVLQSKIVTGTLHYYILFNKFSFLVFSTSHSRSFRTSSKRDKKDYYDVLGIQKTANAKDVKKAYYTVCFFHIRLLKMIRLLLFSLQNNIIRIQQKRKIQRLQKSFKKCLKLMK